MPRHVSRVAGAKHAWATDTDTEVYNLRRKLQGAAEQDKRCRSRLFLVEEENAALRTAVLSVRKSAQGAAAKHAAAAKAWETRELYLASQMELVGQLSTVNCQPTSGGLGARGDLRTA